jgi:hypothetical protein
MFLDVKTAEQRGLQFGIGVQKNVHAETYKFAPTILILNPMLAFADLEVLLAGNIRKSGIFLHDLEASWWVEADLPGALECFKNYGPAWFQQYGNPTILSQAAEAAIYEVKSIADVLEPLSVSEATKIDQVWPGVSSLRRVGPTSYYFASALHYLNGDRDLSKRRTKDWLNSLAPANQRDRDKALAQLDFLSSHN